VKALEVAVNIENGDRLSKAQLFYPREQNGVCEDEFWAALGGKPESIAPAKPDEPPKGTEEQLLAYSLFHVSDASGKLESTEVMERPLDKDKHLNSNDTFILELFDRVFVWQGLGASIEEKRMGMKIATDFIEQKGKPKNTKVSRIPEGCEDAHFKSFFNGFYPMSKMDVGKDNGMDTSTHAK